MVLAWPESGVIKIGFCAQPPILGAKRLLQHNLFNGGSPGRMCVAGGWKVACHSGRMIERCCMTSPGTLVWECLIRTHDHNCGRMALFFPHCIFSAPDMAFNSALCISQSLTLAKWWYCCWGEIISIVWTSHAFWKWESLLEIVFA